VVAEQAVAREVFIERAKAEFSFLEEGGFSTATEGEQSVRYDSPNGVCGDIR
jgi:hypothetical protein